MEELKYAMRNLKNSSPGHDHIPNSLIKLLNDSYFNDLLYIYNQSLATGIVPKQWKMGHIIPIQKPNKKAENCDSYRPICLLPTFGKLLEKVICKRVEYLIESEKRLQNTQFGFRPGRSTNDVLLLMENIIRRTYTEKKTTGVVYIDLKGAFDCVWSEGLLAKLCDVGVKGNVLLWLKNYLSERKYKVRINGILSDTYEMSCGVPQGASL